MVEINPPEGVSVRYPHARPDFPGPASRRISSDAFQSVGMQTAPPQKIAVISKSENGVKFVSFENDVEGAAEYMRELKQDQPDVSAEVILFETAHLKTTVTVVKGREPQ